MSKLEIQQMKGEPLKHLMESHKPKLGKNKILLFVEYFKPFNRHG